MTAAQLRAALNLGPGWTVSSTGTYPMDALVHLCGGLSAPGGTDVNEYLDLPFRPIGQPGLEVAWCARCQSAWVRAARG